MGSTYLSLVNKCLRKLNEVELNSSNFASANGFHGVVKDAVIYAINDINQAEYTWPFNHEKVEVTMVADQREYDLPSDVSVVDWSTFYLQRDDSLQVPPKPIPYVDYNEFNNRYRADDDLRQSNTTALPSMVYRSRNEKFGIYPTPDRAYTVEYEYWKVQTELSAYDDTATIPSRFDQVIVNAAMTHCYDFRENFEESGKSYSAYKQGLKQMRSQLINREYEYFYDTRSSQVLSRRGQTWAK